MGELKVAGFARLNRRAWRYVIDQFSFKAVAIATVILLIAQTIYLPFPFDTPKEAQAAGYSQGPTVVSTGSFYSDETGLNNQRKTFFDGTYYWVFYYNYYIYYRYSTDGQTWSSPQQYSSTGGGNGNAFSLWYDSANQTVYAAQYNTYDIRVKKGTISGTTITWGSEYTALDGSGASSTYATEAITQDSSGKLWVTARYYNGTTYSVRARRSALANDPSSWEATTYDISDAGVASASVYPTIVPLSSNQAYAVWQENTNLKGKLFNGTGWDVTETTISTINSSSSAPSAVVDSTGKIYVGYRSSVNSRPAYRTLTSPYTSWSSEGAIESSVGDYQVTLSLNTSNDHVFAFYLQYLGSGQHKVYYKEFDGTSWDTNPSLVTNSWERTFDKVWAYDADAGTPYQDVTTAASNTSTADVKHSTSSAMIGTASDYLYLGMSEKFYSVNFVLSTVAAGVGLTAEYWNGSAWTSLPISMLDKTSNLTTSARDIIFSPPGDWAQNSVNSSTQYWVRIGSGSNPTTAPVGTQVTAHKNNYYLTSSYSAAGKAFVAFTEGTTSNYSVKYNLVSATSLNVPSLFELQGPNDGAVTSENSPTFSWQAATGVTKYQLYIDGTLNRDNISSAATSTTPTSALSQGSHSWYIMAVGTDGSKKSISTWTVHVDALSGSESVPTSLNSQRKLVRDTAGNLYLAYYKKYQSYYHIYVAKSTDQGQTWSDIGGAPIENTGNYNQTNPSMAIDSSNNLHVVWTGTDSTNTSYSQIKYSTYNGSSWSSWVNLQTVTGYAQSYPSIAIDSSNNLHVVWHGTDVTYPSRDNIKYSKYSGGSWSSWINLTTGNTAYQWYPSIAIDSPSNNLHVAWVGGGATTNPNNWNARYIKYDGSWSSITNLSDVAYNQWNPSIATDSANNVHVVWYGPDASNPTYSQIKYATYNGSSWSSWVNIQTISGYAQASPSITIDASDNLHVFWYGTNATYSTSQIFYSKYTTSWSAYQAKTSSGTNSYPATRWSKYNQNGGSIDFGWSATATSDLTSYGAYFSSLAPDAPTIGTPSSVATTSIQWNWTDNSSGGAYFRVDDNTGDTAVSGSISPTTAYWNETGLTANTQYSRHVHAFNAGGTSSASSAATKYTLSATPNVGADKSTSTWYNTTDVVFTNAAGFGAGGVEYYRYVWDQNATYTFNDTETQWSTGSLTKTATANGSWYLHVKGYNGDNASNGTADYGPYYYDGSAPTDPSGLSATTASTTQINLSWTGSTDNNSGLAGYKIERAADSSGSPATFSQIDTSTGTTYSNSSLSVNTRYWYRLRAYDNIGNNSGYTSDTAKYTLANGPNISSSKDTSTWYNSSSISFTSANLFGNGGVAYYRYAFNENALYSVSVGDNQWSSGTLSIPVVNSGIYYLHVKAYNGDDVATSQVTYGPFHFDIEKPTVSIISHSSGQYVGGIITLVALTSDNIAVADTAFYDNSLSNKIGDSPNTTFDTSNYNGARTIYAKATDNAGNTTVSSIILNIDNVAPTTSTPPSKGKDKDKGGVSKVKRGQTVKVYYKISDNFDKANVKLSVHKRYNKSKSKELAKKTLKLKAKRSLISKELNKIRKKKDKLSKKKAKSLVKQIKSLNKQIHRNNPYKIKLQQEKNLGEVATNNQTFFLYKATKKGIFRLSLSVVDQANNPSEKILVKWITVK